MMLVKGQPYRTNLPGTLQLHVLRQVKRDYALSWSTIDRYMKGLDDEGMIDDVLGDVEFQAWIYTWMLNAGADVTPADIDQLTRADIDFTTNDAAPDPGEVPEPAPTPAATDSEAAAAPRPVAASSRAKRSTKTSRKPSTPASS